MAEKKELDILLERMNKADTIVATKADKVPMSQCTVYLKILEKIFLKCYYNIVINKKIKTKKEVKL